jgi:hypothetical protein
MVDAMESDLLGTSWDVLEAVDEQRPTSVDGYHSHVCCHLVVLQLNCQGWQAREMRVDRDTDSRTRTWVFFTQIVELTYHHGISLGQPGPCGAGLLLGGMKCNLSDPKAGFELTILPSHLRIATLGHPPLPEVVTSIIAVTGVAR